MLQFIKETNFREEALKSSHPTRQNWMLKTIKLILTTFFISTDIHQIYESKPFKSQR